MDSHSFLALRPEWILRNDGYKVVIYELSTSEMHYQILNPQVGVIVSLLNGQRTVAELAEIICYIGRLPTLDQANVLLSSTVEALNAGGEKVVVLDKPANWKACYDPLDFIVSPQEFAPEHRLKIPLSLMLFFSGICQTNCVYCYADTTNMRRLDHLPFEKWLNILLEARELGIRMIQLTGGDSLGRPDSIDFITHLIENEFLFLLSTKCYVSLADALKLVNAGFNMPVNGVSREFQVSIDSSDASVADYLAGRSGYFEQATRTVHNLKEAGIPVRVKAVLTPFNYQQMNEYVETFSALGVMNFMFSLYARSYYRHDDKLFMSDEMKAEIANLLNTIAQKHPEFKFEGDGTRFPSSTPSSGDTQEKHKLWGTRSGCSAGRTTLGIAPDGSAVLCEQMPLSKPYFVGNLTKQSILEVWNSHELLDFIYPPRDNFIGTPCYDCTDFSDCVYNIGYCFRDAYFAYGKLHHPPPRCPQAPSGARRWI